MAGLVDFLVRVATKPRRVLRTYRELKDRVAFLEQQAATLQEQSASLRGQLQEASRLLGEHLSEERDIPQVMADGGIIERESYLAGLGEAATRKDTDVFYRNLSHVFRGSRASVMAMIGRFLPYLEDVGARHPGLPLLDFGCGRGELLDALRERGIRCIGVDMNRESAQEAIDRGHEVVIGDGTEYVASLPDASLAGIAMVMVSEHMPFRQIFEAIFLFGKKIAPGGRLLVNTINPYCYQRFGHFHLDPSHVSFLPPEVYRLVMEMAGFGQIRVVWTEPIVPRPPHVPPYMQYENVTVVGVLDAKREGDP